MNSSSSRINSFSFMSPPRFQIQRDLDYEFRTRALLALNLDGAVVVPHDSVRYCQSQAGTLTNRLGREKRVEDLASDGLGYSRSGVTNRYQEKLRSPAGGDDNLSVSHNGFGSVGNYVHQDLAEPRSITIQSTGRAVVSF